VVIAKPTDLVLLAWVLACTQYAYRASTPQISTRIFQMSLGYLIRTRRLFAASATTQNRHAAIMSLKKDCISDSCAQNTRVSMCCGVRPLKVHQFSAFVGRGAAPSGKSAPCPCYGSLPTPLSRIAPKGGTYHRSAWQKSHNSQMIPGTH